MALEEALQNIKKHIPLKKNTEVGDIVVVGTPGGIFYASVRDIRPDCKKDWYQVSLTILVMPPVNLTWTLRPPQMCGEIFTLNGEEHCMTAVALEHERPRNPLQAQAHSSTPDLPGNVVQFKPRH